MTAPEYLGDGVYASWNDYGMVLTTGHHEEAQADNVIAFEPSVIAALENYLAKAKAFFVAERSKARGEL